MLSGAAGSRNWGRRATSARWIHDVLLVHSGMALLRYDALPVRSIHDSVGQRMSSCGELTTPVSLRTTLDDGSELGGIVGVIGQVADRAILRPHAMPVEGARPLSRRRGTRPRSVQEEPK